MDFSTDVAQKTYNKMTDRVIIHSFHKLLFTATSSESHLGGAGVTGDGQLIGEGGLLWPAGGRGSGGGTPLFSAASF